MLQSTTSIYTDIPMRLLACSAGKCGEPLFMVPSASCIDALPMYRQCATRSLLLEQITFGPNDLILPTQASSRQVGWVTRHHPWPSLIVCQTCNKVYSRPQNHHAEGILFTASIIASNDVISIFEMQIFYAISGLGSISLYSVSRVDGSDKLVKVYR